MENFSRQIYKKQEWQNGEKKDTNIEALKYSEKTAKGKLAKIMKPGFKDFAVRYMNLEEYRELIENGNLSGEFILSDKLFGYPDSFSEFLKEFRTVYSSRNQLGKTMWEETSGITTLETGNIIEQIKNIETNNRGKSVNEKNQIIRNYILQYLNSYRGNADVKRYTQGVDFHSNWTTNSLQIVKIYEGVKKYYEDIDFIPEEDRLKLRQDFLNYVSNNTDDPYPPYAKYAEEKSKEYDLNKNQEKKLMSYLKSVENEVDLGVENLKIIQDFKENPDFLNQKDGLRKIVTALGNIHDWVIQEMQHRQYHLALIVDKNITLGKDTSGSWDVDGWRDIYSIKNINDLKLNASILGVISIYPLKEMHKEISDIEKDSGDLAHPVFDHKGIARWPK